MHGGIDMLTRRPFLAGGLAATALPGLALPTAAQAGDLALVFIGHEL
jgi:hypothetical protein